MYLFNVGCVVDKWCIRLDITEVVVKKLVNHYLLEYISLQLANENRGSGETVSHGDCQVSIFAQEQQWMSENCC